MVRILTDTLACLSNVIIDRYHIPVIPQVINFGNESLYEGIQIDNATFLSRLKSSKELPLTAAPPPELFIKEFERLVPLGEPILCIHPSADISGTVRSAIVAANDFPSADIRIIDTRVVASPMGKIVELAAKWAEDGIDADDIVKNIHEMSNRCRIYFLVDTLEYLARGGRIGGAQALLGSVLQIKPILTLIDGKVDQYERERTHKRAIQRLKEIVFEQIPKNSPSYLCVMHADNLDEACKLAEDFSTLLGLVDIPISDLPPAIVTHGGPGILAAGFFVSD